MYQSSFITSSMIIISMYIYLHYQINLDQKWTFDDDEQVLLNVTANYIIKNQLTNFLLVHLNSQLESMFPNSNNSNPYNASSYNPYQQKSSLNIIVFDQDDSRESQSGIKRHNSHVNLSQSRNAIVVGKQIQNLNEKLKNLEGQAQRLMHQVSYRKTETNLSEVTRNQVSHMAQYEEIINLIEKKIQVIIKQTQKVVSKITQTFEKKLQDKQNNPESNIALNMASFQSQTRRKMIEAIREVENKYQQELQRIKFQNRQIETQMLVRVNSVQESYALKILDFERKERNYIDQIQQLQSKYKKLQNSRSQKKLELTQQKDHSFTKRLNEQKLLPDNINQSKSRENNLMVPPALRNDRSENTKNDTSATRNRKHKIFDLKKENRSKSPVPTNQQAGKRSTSPVPISYSQNSNFVNYANFDKNKEVPVLSTVQPIKPRKNLRQEEQFFSKGPQKDFNSNYNRNTYSGAGYSQKQGQDLYRTKAYAEQKFERDRKTEPLNMQTTPTASQFYKDIPKADSAWQKFDRKEKKQDSESQSDEDVFFYAQNPDQQEKLLSPLDIN